MRVRNFQVAAFVRWSQGQVRLYVESKSLFQNKMQLNFCKHFREKNFLLAPFHPKKHSLKIDTKKTTIRTEIKKFCVFFFKRRGLNSQRSHRRL